MRGARSNLLVAAWVTALFAVGISAPGYAETAAPALSHAAAAAPTESSDRNVFKSLLTLPADVLRVVTLSWWQADADESQPELAAADTCSTIIGCTGEQTAASVVYPGFREAARLSASRETPASYLTAKTSTYALQDESKWRAAISSALETESLVEAARLNRWEPFPTGFNNGVLPAATGNVGMRFDGGLHLSLAYETIDTSHRDAPLAARSSIGPVYEGPMVFATVQF